MRKKTKIINNGFSSAKEIQQYIEFAYGGKGKWVVYDFLDSSLEESLIPGKQFFKCLQRVFEEKEDIFGYNFPYGYQPLRKSIARRYLGSSINPDDILITSGGQEGMYISIQHLKKKKKKNLTVAVEEYTYYGFRHILEEFGCNTIEIPIEEDGLNLEYFERKLKHSSIDVLFIIPDLHNPTGTTLSREKRIFLEELQEKYEFNILANLAHRDLYFNDKEKEIIDPLINEKNFLIGSFSKTIFPSIRSGWLYSQNMDQQLPLTKRTIDICSPSFIEQAISLFLKADYDSHLVRIKNVLKLKKRYLIFLIHHFGLDNNFYYNDPPGGLYLWLTAKPGILIDIEKLLKKHIIVTPGSFFNAKKGQNHMRLCYSKLTCPQLLRSITIISGMYQKIRLNDLSLKLKTIETILRTKLSTLSTIL